MSSENGRQLVPTDGGEQLSVEEREGRWDSAVALMMRVLELYNPGVTDEHFKRSIFQKDVFGAATYQEGLKRVKESPYHGVDNAYNIAYFYLNNRVTFPDSVEFAEQSIIGSFTGAYQDTRVPHRKTLYIVDHGQGSEHRVFSADFTKRGLRQRQGVVSPDVFLASMVNLRHEEYRLAPGHEGQLNRRKLETKKLIIKGADNVIIGGVLGGFPPTNEGGWEVTKLDASIQGLGKCVITGNAEIGKRSSDTITLNFSGDIEQLAGNNHAQVIRAANYLHKGGRIEPIEGSNRVIYIVCPNGQYEYLGGRRINSSNVEVDDSNIVANAAQTASKIASYELGVPFEESGEGFDDKYSANAKEVGHTERGREFRRYAFGPGCDREQLMQFLLEATAEDWMVQSQLNYNENGEYDIILLRTPTNN